MITSSNTIVSALQQKFQKVFNTHPQLYYSPGRINLIGEHTDYNNGFVLPAAIDKVIYVAIAEREDNCIELYSIEFDEQFSVKLSDIKPVEHSWVNYVLGVVAQLISHHHPVKGFSLMFDGNIPIGAGLSSSAAVECAVIYALNQLFRLQLNKLQMVKYAQQAEHEYAGVKCGIMDMFSSMFGKKEQAILLDCRSLEYEYIPVQLKEYSIVLLNTNIKHSLASSAYNERRMQCEQGVEWLKEKYTNVSSLRDADMKMLQNIVLPKDELVYQRCKYIVEENIRLKSACTFLQEGNIIAMGKEMLATHEGLSKEFEVSCVELDFLVDWAKNKKEVAGARMMGGGFGGCTINIVETNKVAGFIEDASKAYEERFNQRSSHYIVSIGDGTGAITI
jgi:galactokinase